MQADYPETFERDTAGTEAEWRARLPVACHGHAITLGLSCARVAIGAGSLSLHWTALAPRRIGLLSMARMSMRFCFEGVDHDTRQRFMRAFDLRMQRGGG